MVVWICNGTVFLYTTRCMNHIRAKALLPTPTRHSVKASVYSTVVLSRMLFYKKSYCSPEACIHLPDGLGVEFTLYRLYTWTYIFLEGHCSLLMVMMSIRFPRRKNIFINSFNSDLISMETTETYIQSTRKPPGVGFPAGFRAFIFVKKLNMVEFIPYPALDRNCKQGSQFREEKRKCVFCARLEKTPWVLHDLSLAIKLKMWWERAPVKSYRPFIFLINHAAQL